MPSDQSDQARSGSSQTIGSLAAKIVNMPMPSASTQTARPEAAKTTRLPTASPMQTIPALTETGATSRLSSALQAGDADEFNAVLRALQKPPPPSLQPLLEQANRPAGMEFVATEVARCLSLTARPAREQTDLKLMIGALSEELTEFPPDVVRTALRKWARTPKKRGEPSWWPTLAEIREECLWRVERRREMLKAMK